MANPYVGPRPFTRVEADRFFGREHEADDLLSLVISQRLVLFYAQSGAGKSSLINTRLIPQLQRSGFAVLPVARIGGELTPNAGSVANVFLLNLMLSLDQGNASTPFDKLHFTDFLANLSSEDGETWYYTEPPSVANLATAPEQINVDNQGDYREPTHVLIIDQFEEIFTTHLEHWHKRTDFFQEIEKAMVAAPNLWVVLVLREDYLAELDPYAHIMTDKLRARYYMQRMSTQAALDAVVKPATQAGRPFAAGVAETLVDNLRQIRLVGPRPAALDQSGGGVTTALGQYVEPVQLQVVCYELWEHLQDRAPGPVTHEDLQVAGDVGTALAQFYEDALGRVLATPELNVSEHQLRNWFDTQLITEAGTRNIVYQGKSETAGLPNRAVALLVNQYLLRTELKAGNAWIELVHDRFIEPILQANRQHQTPLARDAQIWQAMNQHPARLYEGQQLARAAALLAAQPQQFSPLEERFIQAGLALKQWKQQQRQRRMLGGAGIVLLLLAGLSIWAIGNRNIAIQARSTAVAEATLGAKAAATARSAQGEAESAKDDALYQASLAQAAEATAIAANEETESFFLAAKAVSGVEELPQRSLLMAAEALEMRHRRGEKYSPLHEQSLRTVLSQTGGKPIHSHNGWVVAVAFSPDTHRLISGGDDGVVRIWQLDELDTAPRELQGHEFSIMDIAISPNGKLLASAGEDQTVRIWQLTNLDANPQVLRSHRGFVRSVAFSPDGKLLASAGEDGAIRLWSLANLDAQPQILRGHQGAVRDVAFSPDGRLLASGADDMKVAIWQVDAPEKGPKFLSGHANIVWQVAFSPDGKILASADLDGLVHVRPLNNLDSAPQILRGNLGSVRSLAFSPDSKLLATAGGDKQVRLWQVDNLTTLPQVLRGHEGQVWSVAFNIGGRVLASGSEDGFIRLWQVDSPEAEPRIVLDQAAVGSISFSPDGGLLASAAEDGTLRIRQLDHLDVVSQTLRGLAGWGNLVVISPDGKFLVGATADRTVRIWPLDALNAKPIVLQGNQVVVRSLAFSPDSTLLASGGDDGIVRLWHLGDLGADPRLLQGIQALVGDVAFSPDGAILAAGSSDGAIYLWKVHNLAAQPEILRGHEGAVRGVAFAPDGKLLASAGMDRTVRLWSLADLAAAPQILRAHDGQVSDVVFSPNGRLLASASWDLTVRLWPIEDGAAIAEPQILRSHEAWVLGLAFTPDSKILASAGKDGTIQLWTVSVDQLIEMACQTAGRNLSVAEHKLLFTDDELHLTCPTLPVHPSFIESAQ